MIWAVQDILAMPGFKDADEDEVSRRLDAIESFIVRHTNNGFTDRATHEANYPPDVKEGVLGMLSFDMGGRYDSIGVASESLGRHSVTYRDASAQAGSAGGYPADAVAFLIPYMRARF